jgi:uncharacterized protein (TIGR02421 family)
MSRGSRTVTGEFERLAAWSADRWSRNKIVRRRVPGGGRIHMDRQLPFLYVCRTPGPGDDRYTPRLITTEASYLIAPADPQLQEHVRSLCHRMAATLREVFDQVLVMEVWASSSPQRAELPEWEEPIPRFRIFARDCESPPAAVRTLRQALEKIQIGGRTGEVSLASADEISPPGLPPLLSCDDAERLQTSLIGIEIDPIYLDPRTGAEFPLLLRELRPQMSRAMKRAACAFAGTERAEPPAHFESLGRRALVRAVGSSDRLLSEVAESFDFLLLATPTNAETAWRQFEATRFQKQPQFHYRPLPIDPDLLKRRLFNVPLEHIEDPTLAHLLRKKQHELDGQITMLRERGTRQFMLIGLSVFGEVSDALLQLARGILDELPSRALPAESESDAAGAVNATAFAARAQEEIDEYHQLDANFQAAVEITDQIPAGLMVARRRLLVAAGFHTTQERVEPLIHHEVGTHLVTAHNGRAQPFRLAASGLAGYEPLQEGLAVLAEYLVGGLTRARLRVLAARVIAGAAIIRGASFVETFRELTADYGFTHHSAFTITMRIFRGGGLTKDVLYLKGLDYLLAYLREHRDLESLLVGKIALEDVPFIQELRRREIVHPPALEPRYLQIPAARKRLEQAARLTLPDIVRECSL